MSLGRQVFVQPSSSLVVTHHRHSHFKRFRVRFQEKLNALYELLVLFLIFALSAKGDEVKTFRIRNSLRRTYILGSLGYFLSGFLTRLDKITKLLGVRLLVIRTELRLIHNRLDGTSVDYGVVSRHVVTDAGVAYLVDGYDTGTLTPLNFHGVGTTNTAESASQTALVAEVTTGLLVDSTRATGAKTQPSANVFRTTATVNFDATLAIVEHGVFSQAATGGGTMWDRSVHSSVGVITGESITYQHDTTFPSGG